MENEQVVHNVVCWKCGQVWQPEIGSALWWKAKKHADNGFLDAIHVSGIECGCEQAIAEPDAPYRVTGFTDMCEDFDVPFDSIVGAARLYLKLEREGMNTVFFIDTRALAAKKHTRVQERIAEFARGW